MEINREIGELRENILLLDLPDLPVNFPDLPVNSRPPC
jgi:hypothetical protein